MRIMIADGYNLFDEINTELTTACYSGDEKLVLSAIEKGATNWDWGLARACVGGHKKIVDLMVEKGADDWNWGLSSACIREHKELALFMIEKGAEVSNTQDYVLDEIYIAYFIRKGVNIKSNSLALDTRICRVQKIIGYMTSVLKSKLGCDLGKLCDGY